MSYILRRTDGTTLSTVLDGTIDGDVNAAIGTTSLVFVGKNYGPYAQYLADNFIQLLENFSRDTPPNHPLSGQLWYDRTNKVIKVFTGSGVGNLWKAQGTTISSVSPVDAATGEFWFDTAREQLFVKKSNGEFRLIGPATPNGFGNTEIKADTIIDITSATHQILSFYTAGIRSFILNVDGPFDTNINGFANIYTGINANTVITNNKFVGTATDSDKLGGYAAADYARITNGLATSSNVQIQNNDTLASLLIGDTTHIRIHRDTNNFGVLENKVTGAGWKIKTIGAVANALTINTANVGIVNDSPVTTLDVGGSLKTKFTDLGSVSGSVAINTLTAGTFRASLSGSTTFNIQNFTTVGQTCKIIIENSDQIIAWSGTTIVWPNSVPNPNFGVGAAKIAAINLFRTSSTTIATYVTY